MDENEIKKLKAELRNEIRLTDDSLLDKFPIERYLEMIDNYPGVTGYHYVSPEVMEYTDSIQKNSNVHVLEVYHKLLLIELISRNLDKVEKRQLPDAIKQLYLQNFSRIVNSISSQKEEAGFYLYPNDKFFKDLDVCALRMIPVGARKAHFTTLSRGFIFRRGVKQFISGLILIIFKLRSFKPLMITSHVDSHDPDLMEQFSADGWILSCLNIANILKPRKEIKGYCGASWFYDPKLEEISPRLIYLRKIMLDNGGEIFYIGPDEKSKTDALTRSPTRRKLYSEGKYVPTKYLIVWPRNNLLKWAERMSKEYQLNIQ